MSGVVQLVSSPVAAFTYFAASTAVPVCSPSKWWSFSWSDSLGKSGVVHVILVYMWVLRSVYVSQCSRKCCSVSTCLCGQNRHSRSSLGRQVCRCRPVSMAWLWLLSLYTVKVFLSFSSVTVVRYSASVYCLFRAK